MSEYAEALARLNAPERPPGILPSGLRHPIPRYDTAANYNRIMNESRNARVPKYAVEQILDSRIYDPLNPDKSGDCIDRRGNMYRFKLDPTFAFAAGTRKSIAVRGIDMMNKAAGCPLCFRFHVEGNYASNKPLEVSDIMYNVLGTRKLTYIDLIGDMQDNVQTILRGRLDDDAIHLMITLDPEEGQLDFRLFYDQDLYNDLAIVLADDWGRTVDERNAKMFLNIDTLEFHDDPLGVAGLYKCYYSNVYPVDTLIFCASFVNHTQKNIIGSSADDYTYLNLIYPYDNNNQDIFIWVLNRYYKPVTLLGSEWTMRLSLVCDSDYSYVMND